MLLYNVDKARIAYCMVNTPKELIKEWDNQEIHKVDKIDPQFRVTTIDFERDLELEKQIKTHCKAAQEYYEYIINKLKTKND